MNRFALTAIAVGVLASPSLAQGEEDELFDDLEGLEELDDLDALDALEELDAIQGVGGADGGFRLNSFKGFVEVQGRRFVGESAPGNDEQLIFSTELEFDMNLGDSTGAFFRPRFLIDALDTELLRYEPFEAYLEYRQDRWDARVGTWIENWGVADTFNPLDVVNRRDFAVDVLDSERLGETGFRGRLFFDGNDTFGAPNVTAIFLPLWRPTLFPTEDSRFNFGSPTFPFEEDDGLEPTGADQFFYGLRAASTLTTGPVNADLQLIASRGPDRFPLFVPDETGTELIPAYYGSNNFGVGIRAVPNAEPFSRFTLKAETLYVQPFDVVDNGPDTPEDYFSYVFGFDRPSPQVFTDRDELTLTVEYVGQAGADDLASDQRPFQNTLVLRGFYEAKNFSRTSVELRGLLDLDESEAIYEGIFETQVRPIHEDLKFTVAFRYFDQRDGSEGFFSNFPDNSSLTVGLRMDF